MIKYYEKCYYRIIQIESNIIDKLMKDSKLNNKYSYKFTDSNRIKSMSIM